ncbi:MAG: E3 ubiquitin protein ligase [Simkaniaceae bacterium]|nr:E3 ubiquitin protein ligase [Simkaniaceae bacterium]
MKIDCFEMDLEVDYLSMVRVEPANDCPICLDTLIPAEGAVPEITITPCFHQFHEPCLRRWVVINATCPVCRVNIGDAFPMTWGEMVNHVQEWARGVFREVWEDMQNDQPLIEIFRLIHVFRMIA